MGSRTVAPPPEQSWRYGRRSGILRSRRCAARARLVDQQASHDPRRHRQEVRPVAKWRVPHVHQLQIRVMNQPGRIQRSVGVLVAQPMVGQTSKLGVHQWDNAIEGLLVAFTPSAKQPGDVRGCVERHENP